MDTVIFTVRTRQYIGDMERAEHFRGRPLLEMEVSKKCFRSVNEKICISVACEMN